MKRLAAVVLFLAAARVSSAACSPSATRLCLNSGRFAAEVSWKDFQNNTGTGQAVALSSDTGYFWFFSSNNVELVVKVLDGRGLNSSYWVFYGALSTVEYTLTVTDTVTGNVRRYLNASGHLGSVADTSAFLVPGAAREAAGRALAAAAGFPATNGAIEGAVRAGLVEVGSTRSTRSAGRRARTGTRTPAGIRESAATSGCSPTATSLCLNGGRFRVEVEWEDFAGNEGQGQAIPLTSDTGYFWFFNAANVELVIKVLDGRALNQDYWVFFGALSTVQYQVKVQDTLTGRTTYYYNPPNTLASVADTSALGDGTSVQVVHDASRAVTTTIDETGGTITATGADGSTYTLEIPAGALLEQQDVTLTPVQSIAGLPFSGGLAAAVHIEPEALALADAATLTVVPAAPVPLDQTIPFSYQGDGAELFLQPPVPIAGAVRIPIFHFSGYGIAGGSQVDIDAQARRLPTLNVDQFAQRLAVTMIPQLRAGSFGTSAAPGSAGRMEARLSCGAVGNDLRNHFLSQLAPLLALITTDCDLLKQRLPDFWAFLLFTRSLGCASDLAAERGTLDNAIVSGMKHCYDDAFDKCVNHKDPAQVVEISRWVYLLNTSGHGSEIDFTKYKRCVRFDAVLDSRMDLQSDPVGEVQWISTHRLITANIPVHWDDAAGKLKGSGKLQYLTGFFAGRSESTCTTTMTPEPAVPGSTLTVDKLFVRFSLDLGYVPKSPADLWLNYSTSNPYEKTRKVCGSPPLDETNTTHVWSDAYDQMHFDETGQSVKLYSYLAYLKYKGTPSVFALKRTLFPLTTMQGEDPSSPERHVSEDTRLFLSHTPE